MKVSNEVVLLYNIETEKLNKIKFILIRMGARIKIISNEMYLQQIGYLAGIKGFEKKEEDSNLVALKTELFTDEMLIMKGFSNSRIDELLRQMKKSGIEKIQLKAIVTEHNQIWNSIELYKEINKENIMMKTREK